ncbi:MAG: sialate O-acetylesterase [Thermoguttaceae bacterium]|jgi:sialate O-acetylesterase
MKRAFFILFCTVVLSLCSTIRADVAMTKVFTDNAVLQRDMPVRVWGTADAAEKVTVTFGGQTKESVADQDGVWSVMLDAMPACNEGKNLVVVGKNVLTFRNVVVGEVWVCGGQSNMEMPLNSWGQERLACTEDEISGDYSFVRFNRADHIILDQPRNELESTGWLLCKDGVQKSCTAVGFHFAVRLHQELGCPIGLIDSNWGGSNINSWIPESGWKKVPELVPIREKYEADLAAGKKIEDRAKQAGMFNAMLQPWVPYAIRGAIWYQGESNAGEREFYFFKQKAMIEAWRALWGEGDFPFYWVQLASFTPASIDPATTGDWPGLRDGQTKCLELPNTGQAVTIDIGETSDIHPRDKFDVGNRLALWALAGIFGKDVEPQSPTFKSVTFENGKAIVKFDHVGSGLMTAGKDGRNPLVVTPGATPLRFAIGESLPKKNEDDPDTLAWIFADAQIAGNDTVVLSSPYVKNPAAVRYAWQMNPEGCNLYSREGLPATPFRTDK